MTCASAVVLIPVMRLRVVCGRAETIDSFSPTRRFSSVDLPALGRPISATKPDLMVATGWRSAWHAGALFEMDGGCAPRATGQVLSTMGGRSIVSASRATADRGSGPG